MILLVTVCCGKLAATKGWRTAASGSLQTPPLPRVAGIFSILYGVRGCAVDGIHDRSAAALRLKSLQNLSQTLDFAGAARELAGELHETSREPRIMIRKLKSGEYRLYSRKKDPRTGRRRNLGTFKSRKGAEDHERAVQYFKHH